MLKFPPIENLQPRQKRGIQASILKTQRNKLMTQKGKVQTGAAFHKKESLQSLTQQARRGSVVAKFKHRVPLSICLASEKMHNKGLHPTRRTPPSFG